MKDAVPVAALIASITGIAVVAGTLAAHYGVFPYPQVRDAGRTFKALVAAAQTSEEDLIAASEISSVPLEELVDARWTILAEDVPRLPVIVTGGRFRYVEQCPGEGCLAVLYDPAREIVQRWPYEPREIYSEDMTQSAFQHETVMFDPSLNVYPVGTEPYDNGDLLVTFQSLGPVFPFAMGMARVRPDGTPRWTRQDFSHHWPTFGVGGTAFVPSLRVGDGNVRVTLGPEGRTVDHELNCKTGQPMLDNVQIVGPEGEILETIDLLPLLLGSPWAGVLLETTDPCDPLHLNFVDPVGPDATGGLEPGDLILSFRNVSRFAILDSETREIKRVVGGTFLQQHSVQHRSGSEILIFDNRGGDSESYPSRVLAYDLATGGERRVFPTRDTPEPYDRLFSDVGGYLSISPDRQRVLATFSDAGVTAEIEINSGRLLSVYEHLHDLASLPGAPEKGRFYAARAVVTGVAYYSQ